ncbi:hypothetical protein SteCoe_29672 [Stentor coeruleus]|uniref:Uncharacterized protein n=1 Tax=Stentor coeruleus TaxID=5963 RepID=A0A1R2B5I0_9CILI|nr:hypothetical protein SteCoe_29672 [Stentor coeruleus]
MDRQRFSPEKDYAQTVMLQKEIYKKEEKLLGIKVLSEKQRLDKIMRDLKPKFAEVMGELRRDEIMKRGGLEIVNGSKSQFFHRRTGSTLESMFLEVGPQKKDTDRTWDNFGSKTMIGMRKDPNCMMLRSGFKNQMKRRNIFY